MELHADGTANRRITNIEPQNIEGWNRCDPPTLFMIRYSLFESFLFDQTGRSSGAEP
jgi:hypothetical protein